ncbi:MAG: quinone oxidoreductase [Gammaproteobacteria bacterium]|nr:quinone oxidoreductase [Gammaproteobacteria bacterium]
MSHAIQVDRAGGPEVMEWRAVEVGAPGPGELLISNRAIGFNFIDTYFRTGVYPLEYPSGLGSEGAGEVLAVGEGVEGFAPGDRVAYCTPPIGAYSEERIYPADRTVPLPDSVSYEQAAAMMLKGLTSWYLLHHSYPVRQGDDVLLYAAAGGVGQIAAQWATLLGARVIGIVGSSGKVDEALEAGCADVLLADDPDLVARVKELSGGGVAAVYDSLGKDTFMQSLDCLRPLGTMVTFGNATGLVEPIAPIDLARRGSLKLTRPILFDFVSTEEQLRNAAATLFEQVGSGALSIKIGQRYPLQDVAQAHRDAEGRRTTGSTILLP